MPTLAAQTLVEYVARIFAATGAPAAEAHVVADHLVGANLRGHDSHGVIRVSGYVTLASAGTLKPGAAASIVRESASTALLDGGWNYGQIVTHRATEIAIAKARETGVAVVSAFNSGHAGRIGAYGERIVEAGMIALGGVNTPGTSLVAAHGGTRRRLGTNPIMIAIPGPTPAEPFVLDMATSVIAEGKLKVAANKGVHVAPELIIDAEGHPTTDPSDFYGTEAHPEQGALLPVGGATGGHKGSGLNIAIDALGGILSGAGTSLEGPRGSNGVFIMALDPERFAGTELFVTMMGGLLNGMRQPPFAPGVEEVLTAGEPERRNMALRLTHGVPLDEATWEQIVAAGASVGVPAIDPARA